MLTAQPYNPTTDDMWLYEPRTVTYSTGVAILDTPVAWNPNCPLYGYRRSLEGISATYRTFSSWWPAGQNEPPTEAAIAVSPFATACNAVNPVSNPVNRPIWCNSFPPLVRLVGPRMLAFCGHCIGSAATYRSAVIGLTLDSLYPSGGYLHAVSALRFIDGDNNEYEIDRTTIERPYSRDSVIGPAEQSYVWYKSAQDTAMAIADSPLPVNPIATVDPSSIPSRTQCYYLNAGNAHIKPVVHWMAGRLFTTSSNNTEVRYRISDTSWDDMFIHDSGGLMLVPMREPTSAEAGDGVMGVLAHHVFTTFADYNQDYAMRNSTSAPVLYLTGEFTGKPVPFYARQPAAINDDYRTPCVEYWANRGVPMFDLVALPHPDGTAHASQASVELMAAEIAALL